jgi:hypothetical protein
MITNTINSLLFNPKLKIAKKIAIIQHEGGVGKSPNCALAWHFVAYKRWLKRV